MTSPTPPLSPCTPTVEAADRLASEVSAVLTVSYGRPLAHTDLVDLAVALGVWRRARAGESP